MIERPEIQTAAAVFGVDALLLLQPYNRRPPLIVSEARYVAFDLFTRQGFSPTSVARLFGLDHTTVLRGLLRMRELCDVYPDYAARVQEARFRLGVGFDVRDLLRPDTRAA